MTVKRGTELSANEIEVLALAAEGLTDQQIGTRLFISVEAVKSRVRVALRLLGAVNRTQAVAIAFRTGVLS